MEIEFRWNWWNLDHATRHGVKIEEAERIVRFARRRRKHKKGTWYVEGRGNSNRRLEVVYLIDPEGTYYIVHAMPI